MVKPSKAQVVMAKQKIATDPRYAAQVLYRVYNAQQPEEKRTARKGESDGRGWRYFETYTLNRFYETVRDQGWLMSPEQMAFLQERMLPYAEQYLRLGYEETEEAKAELGLDKSNESEATPTRAHGRVRKPMWAPGEKEQVAAMLDRMGD